MSKGSRQRPTKDYTIWAKEFERVFGKNHKRSVTQGERLHKEQQQKAADEAVSRFVDKIGWGK